MSSKKYKLTLTAEGPVHIGDGGKYGKKDYFLTKQGTIAILDVPNFVGELDPDQLNDYCKFLKNDSRMGLQEYLDREKGLDAVAQEAPLCQGRTWLPLCSGVEHQGYAAHRYPHQPH